MAISNIRSGVTERDTLRPPDPARPGSSVPVGAAQHLPDNMAFDSGGLLYTATGVTLAGDAAVRSDADVLLMPRAPTAPSSDALPAAQRLAAASHALRRPAPGLKPPQRCAAHDAQRSGKKPPQPVPWTHADVGETPVSQNSLRPWPVAAAPETTPAIKPHTNRLEIADAEQPPSLLSTLVRLIDAPMSVDTQALALTLLHATTGAPQRPMARQMAMNRMAIGLGLMLCFDPVLDTTDATNDDPDRGPREGGNVSPEAPVARPALYAAQIARLLQMSEQTRAQDPAFKGLSLLERLVVAFLAALPSLQRLQALQDSARQQLHEFTRDMLALRRRAKTAESRLVKVDAARSMVSFVRGAGTRRLFFMANTGEARQEPMDLPPGRWRALLRSDAVRYSVASPEATLEANAPGPSLSLGGGAFVIFEQVQ